MQSNPNERLTSTTWEWRRVKITKRRRPTGHSAAAGGSASPATQRASHLEPREARQPRTVQITYRGGPEAWWELKWANNVVRVSGVIALHDVMRELYKSPEL
jgi:hypothetical protein